MDSNNTTHIENMEELEKKLENIIIKPIPCCSDCINPSCNSLICDCINCNDYYNEYKN